MVMFMSFLIFFDDYTSVLIAGNSMRKVLLTTPTSVRCMCVTLYTQVMQTAGVSKDKFAFIVQSMAPSMASFVPISRFARTPHSVAPYDVFHSWVGAQIGYVSSGLVGCTVKEDPFIIVAKTLCTSFTHTHTHCYSYLISLSLQYIVSCLY